jgi:hypothetical protein
MLIKGLINTSVILLAVGAGVAPPVAASPDEQNRSAQETNGKPQMLAQSKARVPAPLPAAAEHAPSNIDLLNKALNPGASDPDVPLPRPDLARPASEQAASLSGTQFFVRQEPGGGVLGLKMPIAVK